MYQYRLIVDTVNYREVANSPIIGSANIISVPENNMWSANAAGNRSGAALARTSGNSTWTEHRTNPDMAVTANTNQSAFEVTKAEINIKIYVKIVPNM